MPVKAKTRNKFETRTASYLNTFNIDFGYEVENIPYTLKGRYKSDFTITTKSGRKIIVETKGYFRPEDKRKMAAVKKQHPDLDLRILFYAPNRSYEKWAIKHKIPYAFRVIPLSWIEEFQS